MCEVVTPITLESIHSGIMEIGLMECSDTSWAFVLETHPNWFSKKITDLSAIEQDILKRVPFGCVMRGVQCTYDLMKDFDNYLRGD